MNTDASCGVCMKEQYPKQDEHYNEDQNKYLKIIKREKRLLTAVLVLVVLMNIPLGRAVLYPFVLFSTWIHEMCHGMAAILVGGRIHSLHIYANGSGLAYTSLPYGDGYNLKRAFVACAGYTGTAIVGGILLLFRRTTRGPKVGTMGIGIVMLLSCIFVIRNAFGLVVMSLMGIVLVACAWFLKAGQYLGTIFTFLAVTSCLNAITSIHALFDSDEVFVGGEDRDSDAETVAKHIGLSYWFWAACWFLQAFIMLVMGVVFAFSPSNQPLEEPLTSEAPNQPSSGPMYAVTVV